MIKENYYIEVSTQEERIEARGLFESLNVGNYEIYVLCKPTSKANITLEELRELARPKEYLNTEYELVVMNQPLDGWIAIAPDCGAITKIHNIILFWHKDKDFTVADYPFSAWRNALSENEHEYVKVNGGQILWQRNPQQETTMNTEKKGRFLHQEWYEAFGHGEDVQYKFGKDDWKLLGEMTSMTIFSMMEYSFRLKPQTMQIGLRTINKPISVKPQAGQEYYMPSLSNSCKYSFETWSDSNYDKEVFGRNLCHLNAVDAINMADAILELMKEAK